jgi:hypothetical protein
LWPASVLEPMRGGNKMVLNPISVSGDIGINLAAGIADLDLN